MEAIGSQVYPVLVPLLAVLTVAIYTYRAQIKMYYTRAYVYIFGVDGPRQGPVNREAQFGEGQCSICLNQPKKFEVSATCGHSFCCQCLFSIYERVEQKIGCPLCRKPITTMFKSFPDNQQPADQRAAMVAKITRYNDTYDDNRPLIRRLMQFPMVLRRVRRYIFTPAFWVLFIRSFQFFRIIAIVLFYFILPFDLIPERFFGLIGLLDDLLIFGFLLMVGVALFAPIFIRGNRDP